MLEYVDEHDDTIFNQSQMRAVIPELLIVHAQLAGVEGRLLLADKLGRWLASSGWSIDAWAAAACW